MSNELSNAEVGLILKTATVLPSVAIEDLIPAAYNPREDLQPGDKEYEDIANSLREFGFVDPVVINKDMTIIGGHQRIKVAKALGWTHVPCSQVDVDKIREKALNIALNKITGRWKEATLADLLKDIKDSGEIDVGITGYSPKEMEQVFNKVYQAGAVEDDDFDIDEQLKQPHFSKLGDLWVLDRHRIVCGDSTQPDVYEKLMDGQKANLLLTDPPYLVAYENKSGSIKNDNLGDEEGYKFLLECFKRAHENLASESACYVFYASMKARVFHDAFEDAGFRCSIGLAWKKPQLVLGRTDWQPNMEPIIYGWKRDGTHVWYGDRKQTTCFEFERVKDSQKEGWSHPTAKPVPLMGYLMKQSTMENGIVLDEFHGSGATMMACEQLGRICRAVELDEKFIDVEVRRFIHGRNGDVSPVYCIRQGQKLTFEEVLEDAGLELVRDENGLLQTKERHHD